MLVLYIVSEKDVPTLRTVEDNNYKESVYEYVTINMSVDTGNPHLQVYHIS